jgi:hypothetical protein
VEPEIHAYLRGIEGLVRHKPGPEGDAATRCWSRTGLPPRTTPRGSGWKRLSTNVNLYQKLIRCRGHPMILVETQDVVPGLRVLGISRTCGTGVRYFGLSTGICWRCAASDGVLIIWWSDPMTRGLGLKLGFRWGSSRALPAGRGGGARCAIPWEEGSVGRFGDPSPGRPLLLAWYALLRATPFLFRLGVRQDASGQGSCRFRGRPRGGACRKTRSAAVPASRRVARRC